MFMGLLARVFEACSRVLFVGRRQGDVTVTEKEFLAIFYSINKFRHYITGYPTFVDIDHSGIKYLMNKPITNARVTRLVVIITGI